MLHANTRKSYILPGISLYNNNIIYVSGDPQLEIMWLVFITTAGPSTTNEEVITRKSVNEFHVISPLVTLYEIGLNLF